MRGCHERHPRCHTSVRDTSKYDGNAVMQFSIKCMIWKQTTRLNKACEAYSPWQKPSWRNRGSSLSCQWQHTRLRGLCCAEPEIRGRNDNKWFKTKHLRQNQTGGKTGPYQCVVQADVSLQAGADMVELDNGYFCRRDGQDVFHTWWRGANNSKVDEISLQK